AFIDRGGQRLKNMAQPLRAFEVVGPGGEVPSGFAGRRTASRRFRLGLGAATAVLLIALAVAGWWQWISPPSMGLIASQQAGGPGMPAAVSAEGTPARSVPAQRLSIVVLPFANLSNDPEQEYFADGITEDLTTDLSRIADMLVISRNTAFTYRNKPVDTRQIGRELGVRYVLEGSVRRSANQVRVNAQLIDAETDAHLWAERFDRDRGDLFALQNEITSRIAVALNLELVTAG